MDERLQNVVNLLKRDVNDMGSRVKETVSAICTMVNCFGVDVKETADTIARTPAARKKFLEYCEKWVLWLNFASKKGLYDGRNEIACERGADVFRALKFSSWYVEDVERAFNDWHSNIESEMFAIKMGNEHRTLQQTFTKIVFYMLYNYGGCLPSNAQEKLQEAIDNGDLQEEFWKMPMI